MPDTEYHIITMAKVASASFSAELKATGAAVKHYHSLTKLKMLLGEDKNVIIITGIREFVARNISYFFQTFTDNFTNDLDEYCFVAPVDQIKKMNMSKIIDHFFEKSWHATPILWWEGFCGIIGQKPRKSQLINGFYTFNFKNASIVMYRVEDLPSIVSYPAILPINDLQNKNTSEKRWYYDKYSEFLEKVSFPKSYLNHLLLSAPMRQMYSEEEISIFFSRYKTHPTWF